MQCPCCGSLMRQGRVTRERSTLGLINDAARTILGEPQSVPSPRYLYFHPEDAAGACESPDLSGRGHHCGRCGALLLEGTPREEPVESVVCLSCGKEVPPEQTACPACGWTWEED